MQASRDNPLRGVKQQETQENCGVTVEEVRQTGNDDVMRIIFGSAESMEDTRNLHCDAEPKQIEIEKMKLPQIREAMEQNAEG